jgi:NADH:ubiquinone oxidoreductase subunit 6 (subunit J)
MKNKLAIILAILLFVVMTTFIQPSAFPNGVISINAGSVGNGAITHLMFTTYILPFEIITFLLLAAMLGAMYLGEREGDK